MFIMVHWILFGKIHMNENFTNLHLVSFLVTITLGDEKHTLK